MYLYFTWLDKTFPLGIDSLPIPIEKPVEIQTFEFAQEIIALPEEDKSIALSMIRDEIKKRGIEVTYPI